MLDTQFTLPVFLRCNREEESGLPGCLFKYDSPDEQCHEGRKGKRERERVVSMDDIIVLPWGIYFIR